MKVCGHEHITVEGCDTCYIVKLKKRVDKLLATEYKRLARIAELEAVAEAAVKVCDAGFFDIRWTRETLQAPLRAARYLKEQEE
jgi:protein gp37